MRSMASINPRVAELVDSMSMSGLKEFARKLVLATSGDFSSLDDVDRYRGHLQEGCALDSIESGRFRQLSKELDEEYLRLEEGGEPEEKWESLFRQARYAYALSCIAAGVEHDSMDTILYEMGYAHADQDGFWTMALDIAEALAKEPGALASGAELQEIVAARRAHEKERAKANRAKFPPKKTPGPSLWTTWRWQRKIAKARPGMSKPEIEERLGRRSRQLPASDECDLELWIYDLRRIGNVQYSIRVVFSDGRVTQAYLGMELLDDIA